jgi:hypothetical protein
MDKVYTFLPSCIPVELHPLIHMFAGTCTPSCKIIKTYINYIENNRFVEGGHTLWSSYINWNTPRYLKRWANDEGLTNQELDLKVAWHFLKREQFINLKQFLNNGWNAMSFEYTSTMQWFEMSINDLNEELTKRLFRSLEEWVETREEE